MSTLVLPQAIQGTAGACCCWGDTHVHMLENPTYHVLHLSFDMLPLDLMNRELISQKPLCESHVIFITAVAYFSLHTQVGYPSSPWANLARVAAHYMQAS